MISREQPQPILRALERPSWPLRSWKPNQERTEGRVRGLLGPAPAAPGIQPSLNKVSSRTPSVGLLLGVGSQALSSGRHWFVGLHDRVWGRTEKNQLLGLEVSPQVRPWSCPFHTIPAGLCGLSSPGHNGGPSGCRAHGLPAAPLGGIVWQGLSVEGLCEQKACERVWGPCKGPEAAVS